MLANMSHDVYEQFDKDTSKVSYITYDFNFVVLYCMQQSAQAVLPCQS